MAGAKRVIARYLVSLVLVSVSVWGSLRLSWIDGSSTPLLFTAVFLSAFFAGFGPSILATVLATLAEDYYFVGKTGVINFDAPVQISLTIFLLVATITSFVTARLRSTLAERNALLKSERIERLKAEEANRIKDHFFAVASHEFRGPLSGISLWCQLLQQQQLGSEATEGVESISRCANSLQTLVGDLLDIARLQTGKMHVEPARVSLVRAIDDALRSTEKLCSEKSIHVQVSSDGLSKTDVWMDPVRLQQTLCNVIGNAAKFTPANGAIWIEAAANDLQKRAVVRVRDNGRGIDPQDLSHVFDSFWQETTEKRSASDGLGLGLAIAHDLLKLQGGSIRAESEGRGKGATFVIELPLAESPKADSNLVG
jgi:signal transduction histidine kinase